MAVTGLLDRDGELAGLRGALDAARDGRGQVVLVEGAAGAGKSALVAASRDLASASGMHVLSARGGELERDFPFGVIRQLYEHELLTSPEEKRARLLAGAATPAAWALGLEDGSAGMHAAGFATLRALYWLTSHAADDQPLALVVDDAHWSDISSLRALDYLARRIGEARVCLIVTLRPEEPGAPAELLDALRSTPGALRLSVRPLAPESVAQLVRDRLQGADDEACAACHEVTGGNPLYLEELMRELDEDRDLHRSELVRRASVPSLGDRVLRRVQQVSEGGPALARAAAVLGEGARLSTVAALARVPETVAGQIAHKLARIEVLAAEDPVSFVHPLIRRSVYDAIPVAERQSMHREAARLLERGDRSTEAVAAQLYALKPAADPSVAGALASAAQLALERAAPDEAAAWIQRALDEGAPAPPRAELLYRLGIAKTLQRNPAAIAPLREAYATAEERGLRGRVGIALAEVLAEGGEWSAAHETIESVEADLDQRDPELRAEAAALRGVITLYDPVRIADFDRRRAYYLELSDGDFWASRALTVLLAVEAVRRGRTEESRALCRRALAGGRLLIDRGPGWPAPQLLSAFLECGDYEGAAAATEQVDAAARASGSAFGLITAVAYRGWAAALRGDLAAAEADLVTATEASRQADLLMGITTAVFLLLDVLLERRPKRVTGLVESTELPPDFLETISGAMLLEARGSLRVCDGDRDRGIDDLRAAGRIHSALRFGPTASSWRSRLALALPRSDRDEALRLAREELDLARATGVARPVGIALRTVGVLEDPDEGVELLRESVAVLEGSPERLEHARSLVELGAALRRANQRLEARKPLTAGATLAHACGAPRLTRRAREELRAAGGRRPHLYRRGIDALTASELRVAQLAASGATNADIAQELYVSLKTVETHLSSTYSKLGLAGPGSRARLAQVLGEPDQRLAVVG